MVKIYFLESKPLHIWALWSLAVAQPLLDLLGRTPDFFVARQLGVTGMWLIAGTLLLVLPAILVLMVAIIGRLLGPKARDGIHLALVCLLATLLAGLFVRRVPISLGLSGTVALVLATLLGLGFGLIYYRRVKIRQIVGWLAPLALVVPVMFLGFSPAAKLIRPAASELQPSGHAGVDRTIDRPTPVVFVVFDELPITSLLAGKNKIDAELFPAFSELANTATWYRRATTVATLTVDALPAILTGNYPHAGDVATREHHPQNLFTVLSPEYQIHALEPRTNLAPPSARITSPETPASLLATDLAVIYLHLLLMADLSRHLPDITTQWDAFGVLTDKAAGFRQMLDTIDGQERPGLYFAHAELPHHPWIYLASGKDYPVGSELFMEGLTPGFGPAPGRWLNDPWLVTQAQQRHLIQTCFTDRLLGELLTRLQDEKLWDESLVIVTADHGIGFVEGGYVRRMSPENWEGVMAVPLFIKLPGQREGRLDLRDAELVDLIPTLTDALGVALDTPVDGQSLLAENSPAKPNRFIYHHEKYKLNVPVTEIFPEHSPTLERRLRIFGPESDVSEESAGDNLGCERLYRIGPYHRELLGRDIGSQSTHADSLRAVIDNPHHYYEVDLGAHTLPARVSGRFTTQPEGVEGGALALTVGGVVRATAPLQTQGEFAGRFSFMVPEWTLQSGKNDLALYLVNQDASNDDSSQLRLEPIALSAPVDYQLIEDTGDISQIVSSTGERFIIEPDIFESEVIDRLFKARAFRVELVGWAREVTGGEAVKQVLVFADGKLLHSGVPNLDSPELTHRYPVRFCPECGFVFFLPRERFEGEVRIFALTGHGVAGELAYTKRLVPMDHVDF